MHLSFGINESIPDTLLSGEWWQVLGVDRNAHTDEVKRAYRRLSMQYHPDINRCGSAKANMQAIKKFWPK
ncbi:J domain-containing protein [Argonema antarcticum]|uniref:J domain-containing protein n=1 Tax=Argonema antarcticum TaxID=2942763 RepID=UPI0023DFE7F9|nr:DnaJ domain-containing protein [Argonema antarcticum]